MYVLIENNTLIHFGPIDWNPFMFQNVIKEILDMDIKLPLTYTDSTPIEITPGFIIYPAKIVYPQIHNKKIHQFAGPFWNIIDDIAIGTYKSIPKDINVVKNELKAIVADNRWKMETKGIKIIIQGQEVFITTNRGDRDIFLQALQILNPNDTRAWKFNNIWLTLTYSDLQLIVSSIVAHVQTAFDWDKNKGIEIDNCTISEIDNSITLEQLDAIDLLPESLKTPNNRVI